MQRPGTSQAAREDYQFELDITVSNIKHLQDKIQGA